MMVMKSPHDLWMYARDNKRTGAPPSSCVCVYDAHEAVVLRVMMERGAVGVEGRAAAAGVGLREWMT